LNAISVKSEQYAQLGGKVKSSKSWLSLYFSIAFSPLVKWLKGYIWLQGFRLGLLGWDLEKTLALETFKKYKYAIQYKKRFN
jgi:hypothetical protein